MDYALSLLKHALRVDQATVRDYTCIRGKGSLYFKTAVRLAKKNIPSLQRAIQKLENK